MKLLLHLMSKVEPAMLGYRPSPGQRSLLELLQYLTIMGPIHTRGCVAEGPFDMDAWREAWKTGEATAKQLDLEAVKESIAQQPALFQELFLYLKASGRPELGTMNLWVGMDARQP